MFWSQTVKRWAISMTMGIVMVWTQSACESADPDKRDGGSSTQETFVPGADSGIPNGSFAEQGNTGGTSGGSSGSVSGGGMNTVGGNPNPGDGMAAIGGGGNGEELPDLNCDGLIFTDQEVCLKKANGVLPMNCKGLQDNELNQCCSRVNTGLPDKVMANQYFPECTQISTASDQTSGVCTEADNQLLSAQVGEVQPVMGCYIGNSLNAADPFDGCEAQHRIGAVLDWCMRDCLTNTFPTITPACADCFGQAQQTINDNCTAQCLVGGPICMFSCATVAVPDEFTKCY